MSSKRRSTMSEIASQVAHIGKQVESLDAPPPPPAPAPPVAAEEAEQEPETEEAGRIKRTFNFSPEAIAALEALRYHERRRGKKTKYGAIIDEAILRLAAERGIAVKPDSQKPWEPDSPITR